ncbi:hypothetical protein [Xylophilus rhododendri]|uniref:hypothetical protein n=1 Tax=Xylophilus rhododendri TaxID=2697032 RepID=UPI00389ACC14
MTYNARYETVAKKAALTEAWKSEQHCVIPAQPNYEPERRSGKVVPTLPTVSGPAASPC